MAGHAHQNFRLGNLLQVDLAKPLGFCKGRLSFLKCKQQAVCLWYVISRLMMGPRGAIA